MATPRLVSPVAGRVQTGAGAYGWRTNPSTGRRDFHAGQDVACPIGTPILAPEPGVVVAVGWAGSGLAAYRSGIFALMRGDWTGRDHYFGHCSETIARAGRRIAQGDPLALSGNTGNSTGPHVHVETRRAGTLNTLEPLAFYSARGVTLGDPGPRGSAPGIPTSPPGTVRRAPVMFVTKFGSSRFVLVTGDRAVFIGSTTYTKLAAAGIPAVALDNVEVEKLLAALVVEG